MLAIMEYFVSAFVRPKNATPARYGRPEQLKLNKEDINPRSRY